MTYEEAGDFARAESNWREAVQRRPYWRHWNGLGMLLWKTGDHEAAAAAFENAAELAPGISMPLEFIGALAMERGDFSAAVAAFEPYPKPITEAAVATNLGTAYFYLGRLDEAEQSFRLAVRLRPKRAPSSNLGDLLVQRDKPLEARSAYRAAARLLGDEFEVNPTNHRVAFQFAVQRAQTGDCSGLESHGP